MDFKKLTLSELCKLKPYFTENTDRLCDFSVGGTFIWRDYFDTHFALFDGTLYFKINYPTNGIAVTPPVGAEFTRSRLQAIVSYFADNGEPARICALSERMLKTVCEYYPAAKIKTDRAWSDYLYNSTDITQLSGRKYSGQRNHINRFLRECGDWSFQSITSENINDVRSFFSSGVNGGVYPAYEESKRKTLEVLDNFDLYGHIGGALFIEDRVKGATLGEILGDTLYIHIEKADTEQNGTYPMLVNQFAKMFAQDTLFINREEDDGVEGLRKSKLSYHPAALLDKYIVTIE